MKKSRSENKEKETEVDRLGNILGMQVDDLKDLFTKEYPEYAMFVIPDDETIDDVKQSLNKKTVALYVDEGEVWGYKVIAPLEL